MTDYDIHTFQTTDVRLIADWKLAKKKAMKMLTQDIKPEWEKILLAFDSDGKLSRRFSERRGVNETDLHNFRILGGLRHMANEINAYGFIKPDMGASSDTPVTFFFENMEDAVLVKIKYG